MKAEISFLSNAKNNMQNKTYTIKISRIVTHVCLCLILCSCHKLDLEPVVKVKTLAEYHNLSCYSVTVPGSVIDMGDQVISEYGHCWSTNSTPTISDFRSNHGRLTTTSDFISELNDLEPATVYFYRAYATSNGETVYGEQVSFKTIREYYAFFPFDDHSNDIKGNVYSSESPGGITIVNDNERGNVLELDGQSGYLTFNNTIKNFENCTYNIWFKADVIEWWARIFDFGINSSFNPDIHDVLFLTVKGSQSGNMQLHYYSTAWSVVADTVLYSTDPISANQWYMVTVAFTPQSIKLYLNGDLQDETALDNSRLLDMDFGNLYLGKSNWPDELFDGRFDDFTIWNIELTQEEISAIAQ